MADQNDENNSLVIGRNGSVITVNFTKAARSGETLKQSAHHQDPKKIVGFKRAVARRSVVQNNVQNSDKFFYIPGFTPQELEALDGLYMRGEKEKFFGDHHTQTTWCDYKEYCFLGLDKDDTSPPAILTLVKGCDDNGIVGYATKSILGEIRMFRVFDDAVKDIDDRINVLIQNREETRDRVRRADRLGQPLQPLSLVKK